MTKVESPTGALVFQGILDKKLLELHSPTGNCIGHLIHASVGNFVAQSRRFFVYFAHIDRTVPKCARRNL